MVDRSNGEEEEVCDDDDEDVEDDLEEQGLGVWVVE